MPKSTLVIDQLYENIVKAAESEENRKRHSAPAPRIALYLENVGWADYLNFDMNEFLSDPVKQTEISFQQNLIQFETFAEDTVLSPNLGATVCIIWEMSMLGLRIKHTMDGVPYVLDDHGLRRDPSISLLKRHKFTMTGDMPAILRMHNGMREIADGRWEVAFPYWHRGPLDIGVDLRGYENFVGDTLERPQFVHDLMKFIVEERMRWWDEYCRRFSIEDRSAGISDDWMNVPFISPSIFRDFVLPYYLELERYHGAIPWVHSCGNYVPLMPYLLEMKSLHSFEINSWMNFDDALMAIPIDKNVTLIPRCTDVLVLKEEEAERDLREKAGRLQGRDYSILVGGLRRIHDSWEEDISRIQRWIGAAKRAVGRE